MNAGRTVVMGWLVLGVVRVHGRDAARDVDG